MAFDIASFEDYIQASGYIADERLLKRLIASLQTKHFLILAGGTGTGKTKLAQLCAHYFAHNQSLDMQLFDKNKNPSGWKHDFPFIVHEDRKTVTVRNENANEVTLPKSLVITYINCAYREFKGLYPESSTSLPNGVTANGLNVKNYLTEKYRTEFDQTKTDKQTQSQHASLTYLCRLFFETHPESASYPITQKEVHCSRVVAVNANWIDAKPLLGYFNPLDDKYYATRTLELLLAASAHPETPFFLILDEMNLSPVEKYFASFLSAMESNESLSFHGFSHSVSTSDGILIPSEIAYPANLFVIGTVNIDESTNAFSPKVLDRANVIELTPSQNFIADICDGKTQEITFPQAYASAEDEASLLQPQGHGDPLPSLKEQLQIINNELESINIGLGYRTICEIFRFASAYKALKDNATEEEILDIQLFQKILPHVQGPIQTTQAPLSAIASAFKGKAPLSEAKIKQMLALGIINHYISFF